MDREAITNEFLQAYLEYVRQTEPPLLMHVWSAIGAVAACMGRHVSLPVGVGNLFANNYILLVGPPGTRKSTAIKFATRLVQNATDVRFAPDDTGGQRQGLLTALVETEDLEAEAERLNLDTALTNVDQIRDIPIVVNGVDRHVMCVNASEFGSFMGQNNMDMVRFMIRMWDGDDYTYQLRQSSVVIKEPLLTLLGGTTPTDMSMLLPAEAIGQGFMSRIILVFARNKERKIARPKLNMECVPFIEDTFKWLHEKMHGEMQESAEAETLLDSLYLRPTAINDNRFIYYAERRHTHLIKLAMALAAARRSYRIDTTDVEQAEMLLSSTEVGMPEALGEYGLSPLAVARQRMIDFVTYAGQPVHEQILWAVMQRDMKLSDFKTTLAGLVHANKIQSIPTPNGHAFIPCDELKEVIEMLGDDGVKAMLKSTTTH